MESLTASIKEKDVEDAQISNLTDIYNLCEPHTGPSQSQDSPAENDAERMGKTNQEVPVQDTHLTQGSSVDWPVHMFQKRNVLLSDTPRILLVDPFRNIGQTFLPVTWMKRVKSLVDIFGTVFTLVFSSIQLFLLVFCLVFQKSYLEYLLKVFCSFQAFVSCLYLLVLQRRIVWEALQQFDTLYILTNISVMTATGFYLLSETHIGVYCVLSFYPSMIFVLFVDAFPSSFETFDSAFTKSLSTQPQAIVQSIQQISASLNVDARSIEMTPVQRYSHEEDSQPVCTDSPVTNAANQSQGCSSSFHSLHPPHESYEPNLSAQGSGSKASEISQIQSATSMLSVSVNGLFRESRHKNKGDVTVVLPSFSKEKKLISQLTRLKPSDITYAKVFNKCAASYVMIAVYMNNLRKTRNFIKKIMYPIELKGIRGSVGYVIITNVCLLLYVLIQMGLIPNTKDKEFELYSSKIKVTFIFRFCCINSFLYMARRAILNSIYPMKSFSFTHKVYHIPLVSGWLEFRKACPKNLQQFYSALKDELESTSLKKNGTGNERVTHEKKGITVHQKQFFDVVVSSDPQAGDSNHKGNTENESKPTHPTRPSPMKHSKTVENFLSHNKPAHLMSQQSLDSSGVPLCHILGILPIPDSKVISQEDRLRDRIPFYPQKKRGFHRFIIFMHRYWSIYWPLAAVLFFVTIIGAGAIFEYLSCVFGIVIILLLISVLLEFSVEVVLMNLKCFETFLLLFMGFSISVCTGDIFYESKMIGSLVFMFCFVSSMVSSVIDSHSFSYEAIQKHVQSCTEKIKNGKTDETVLNSVKMCIMIEEHFSRTENVNHRVETIFDLHEDSEGNKYKLFDRSGDMFGIWSLLMLSTYLFVIVGFTSLVITLEFELADFVFIRSIDTPFGTWNSRQILYSSVLNTVIICSKRCFYIMRDPGLAVSLGWRVVQIPYTDTIHSLP